MDEVHVEILNSCFKVIVRDMDVASVVDYLIGTNPPVLLRYHANEIRKIVDSDERNRKFLTILEQRGEFNAYKQFLEALKHTQQNELYTSILIQSNKLLHAKYSDKNSVGRNPELRSVSNLPLSDAAQSDNALQNQAPSTSSATPSQPNNEDWQRQLESVQSSLKEMYLIRFKKVYPFSLPFTFDIENTWVSLALKEEKKDSQATEDHVELLNRAFDQVNMLIIEGDPATGKTSLMRRLAYEWARKKEDNEMENCINATTSTLGKRKMNSAETEGGKRTCMTYKRAKETEEILRYDLVIYAEFREVREKRFESVGELVLSYTMNYLNKEAYENLKSLINDEQFCKRKNILLVLDGYDESSLDEQCLELKSYLLRSTVDKPLLFHVVITTRKGYLSNLHGLQGRFIFAEVLGFPTKKQKEKYISNHFHSTEIDYQENMAAVYRLLAKNRNLNKIAETPLLLTFICLVHERIVDGTLVELYCNIIWWLIDRYQKNYPDRDIPALFGFETDSGHKFKTIQDHYLHFPQLHRVAEMALHNVEKDVFSDPDYQRFNLQPIIERVGLLRKEEKHDDSYKLVTSYFFPHRTIQEFLAAFYYFYTVDETNLVFKKASVPTSSKLIINKINEFQKFLLRISLSDKIPMNMDKRKIYFESKTDLQIYIKFDAFNTTTGFNNQLLNRLTSQCTNITNIELHGKTNMAKNEYTSYMLGSVSKLNRSKTGAVPVSVQLTVRNYANLFSSSVQNCTFNPNSQLTFTSCTSLKNFKFIACNTKSTVLSFAELPVIDTVEFGGCTFSANSQLSFTNCPSLKKLRFNDCVFSTTKLNIMILSAIYIVQFDACTFSDNCQLSFTDCPSLRNLTFRECHMKSRTIIDIATLPEIDTVQLYRGKIDLATWQSVTNAIMYSFVKYFHLSADYFAEEKYPEFLYHLQKCERIQKIYVKDTRDSDRYYILNRYEESVTANLALTARELPALTSIIISDEYGTPLEESRRLCERNREQIEKAGQQRNSHFSIKYVEGPDSELNE